MTSSNNPKKTLIFVVIGILALIVFLAILKPKPAILPVTEEAAHPVQIQTVHLTNATDVITLPGLLTANMDITLAAEQAGRIVDLSVDRGDQVTKGQLLLQLDDRIWKAERRQVAIILRDATNHLARLNSLKKTGAVAPSDLERAEAEAVSAQSNLERVQVQLDQCQVRAPVDGVINERWAEKGEYAQPGAPALQLVDLSCLKLRFQVPERDVTALQLGDNIPFHVTPIKGKTFTGTVSFIAVQASAENNAFPVELTVTDTAHQLRPGMIAEIQFERGQFEQVVSLPMSVVLPSKGDHVVYLAREGRAVRRKIQLEEITGDQALISDGLQDGDQIIVAGHRTLNDGQRIEIFEDEAAE